MSTTLAWDLIARDRASHTFDKVGDSVDRSSSKLKAWAKVGAVAVAAGAVLAGKALFDMGKAAAEDAKGAERLAVSLRNTTGATDQQVAAVESWISAQGRALGVTDDQLRPALQRLVQATGDVDKAQKLSALAMDISAGSGKSLESVSSALAKAQLGNMKGLQSLGVATKNADGSTRSLRDITADLAKTYSGQASAAADTASGKWGRLKLMWDETKESIGAKLLPMGERLADWLIKMSPHVERLGTWFNEKLKPPLKELAEKYLAAAKEGFSGLKDGAESARPFLELVAQVVQNVLVPGLKKFYEAAGPAMGLVLRMIGTQLGAVGTAATFMWNNALAPALRFMAKGVAMAAEGWAALLRGMSKIPGFGWAGKAADALENAARKARGLGESIQNIPSNKNVRINVNVVRRVTGAAIDIGGQMASEFGFASGTSFAPGGYAKVHKDERIYLPRGAQVLNPHQSRQADATDNEPLLEVLKAILAALLGMPIARMPDSGQGAYLRGGI